MIRQIVTAIFIFAAAICASYASPPVAPYPAPVGTACVAGVAYSTSLTGDTGNEANNAFRTQTGATTTGTGCTHVTVEFVASAAGGNMTVNHASICIQNSTSSCTATPTPLLVSGSAGFTVVQGTPTTSDSTVFSFTTGQILLVSLDFGSPANARSNGSSTFYFCTSCAIASQQSPAGLSTSSGTVGFDKITVLP